MRIADISIERPVMTVMMIGSLMLLGYVSIDRLGVDLFPKIEFPFITVETRLDGASPQVIETEVTDLLEEEINATAGIKTLTSVSTDGYSQVHIEFGLDENPDIKAQEIRNKVDRVLPLLPSEAQAPVVQKMDPDSEPVVTIMVSADMAVKDLTRYAKKQIKERLQRLDGVGGVNIVGGREREVRIWVDAYKLRSYQLSVGDVIQAVQREHAEIPGGRLDVASGHREFTMKTIGEVTRIKEFEKIVVARRGQASIRIGDVARVVDGMEDERTYAELNGSPGVALEVRRQSGKNTVAVVEQIHEELEKIKAEAPPGVQILAAKDISRFIKSSIKDVKIDLMIGITLVVIVVLAFLMNLKATIIVATAIPAALISTFFAFYVLDFTVNMLTMMALSVAIGLLVDDAIVVLESVFMHLEKGLSPSEAASQGTSKVGGAVIAGTLSIMAVFVPIAFMDGIVGRFFFQYGLTIVFSVGISLLVSLTLTPMLCAKWLDKHEQPSGFYTVFEAVYQSVENLYKHVLSFALQHRWMVILFAMASVYAGGKIAGQVPMAFASKTDRSEFSAKIEMPLGTGIEQTKLVGRKVADAIGNVPNVNLVFMSIGSGTVGRADTIDYYIGLVHKSERDLGAQMVLDQVREVLYEVAPQAKSIQMAEIPWVSGGSGAAMQTDLYVVLQGPELTTLQSISEGILTQMNKRDFYNDVRTTFDMGKPEVHVEIDRQRAADLGISVRDLASTISATVGGQDIATYQEAGERFDVRIRLEEDNRDELNKLKMIQVRNSNGELIDVSNVATFRIARVPVQINRRNRSRQISIFAMAPAGVAIGILKEDMDNIIAGVDLPPGYSIGYEGSSEEMEEIGRAIVFAFAMALVALYIILASQFNSFGQPMVIMLTAPLSFIGAFASLYVFNGELSLFAQIGLVALMGLVMKNGILLVDYANQVRLEGLSAYDAMITAGQLRLRPVLMTAFSTICGMIPVAFSTSDGAEFRSALGLIVIGGLSSSTALTLVVVPVAYTLYDDLLNNFKRLPELIAKVSFLHGATGNE